MEIQAHTLDVMFPNALVVCADESYYAPDQEWVLHQFCPWYRRCMVGLKVLTWRNNHDCDDKATGFRWLAGVCWGRRTVDGIPQGIAVGEIHYTVYGGGGHAINVVITSDYGTIFIEPQTQQRVTLKQSEIDSIHFARF